MSEETDGLGTQTARCFFRFLPMLRISARNQGVLPAFLVFLRPRFFEFDRFLEAVVRVFRASFTGIFAST